MSAWLIGVVVFFVSAGADFIFARYTIAVTEHRPFAASGLAAVIAVIGAIYWTAYDTTRWLVVAIACGAALGTFIAVEHKKRSTKKESLERERG